MKTNFLKFQKYQVKSSDLAVYTGGSQGCYRGCIIAAIHADEDYDENQNEWQDGCAEACDYSF